MRKSRSSSLTELSVSTTASGSESTVHDGPISAEFSEPRRSNGIFVVGSDRLFREALKLFLENAGLSVLAEGKNLAELCETARPGSEPDVLIYSLHSAGLTDDDLGCLRELRQKFPNVRTIALAETISPSVFLQTVSAGIEGLLLKDISGDVLQRAIGLVLLGQHLFPIGLAQILLPAATQQPRPASLAMEPRSGEPVPGVERDRTVLFSEREQQILQCLVGGFSNKAIARKLHIAEATVKVHVKGLLRKVQVSNRTQAAIWALSRGVKTTAHQQMAAE